MRPLDVDGRIGRRGPEVVSAREILMSAVALSLLEQLGRADTRESCVALPPRDVHSALTARERQIGRLDVTPEAEPRDERVVLVLGTRADDQHARTWRESRGRPSPCTRG